MASKKRSDEKVAASAAAFEKVRGKWTALTSEEVGTLNADLDLAATAGLVLVALVAGACGGVAERRGQRAGC